MDCGVYQQKEKERGRELERESEKGWVGEREREQCNFVTVTFAANYDWSNTLPSTCIDSFSNLPTTAIPTFFHLTNPYLLQASHSCSKYLHVNISFYDHPNTLPDHFRNADFRDKRERERERERAEKKTQTTRPWTLPSPLSLCTYIYIYNELSLSKRKCGSRGFSASVCIPLFQVFISLSLSLSLSHLLSVFPHTTSTMDLSVDLLVDTIYKSHEACNGHNNRYNVDDVRELSERLNQMISHEGSISALSHIIETGIENPTLYPSPVPFLSSILLKNLCVSLSPYLSSPLSSEKNTDEVERKSRRRELCDVAQSVCQSLSASSSNRSLTPFLSEICGVIIVALLTSPIETDRENANEMITHLLSLSSSSGDIFISSKALESVDNAIRLCLEFPSTKFHPWFSSLVDLSLGQTTHIVAQQVSDISSLSLSYIEKIVSVSNSSFGDGRSEVNEENNIFEIAENSVSLLQTLEQGVNLLGRLMTTAMNRASEEIGGGSMRERGGKDIGRGENGDREREREREREDHKQLISACMQLVCSQISTLCGAVKELKEQIERRRGGEEENEIYHTLSLSLSSISSSLIHSLSTSLTEHPVLFVDYLESVTTLLHDLIMNSTLDNTSHSLLFEDVTIQALVFFQHLLQTHDYIDLPYIDEFDEGLDEWEDEEEEEERERERENGNGNISEEKERINFAGSYLKAFYSQDRISSLLETVLLRFFILREGDIEMWENEPESFLFNDEMQRSEDHIRPAARGYYYLLLKMFRSITVPCLLQFLNYSLDNFPPVTKSPDLGTEAFHDLLMKEVVLHAMGVASEDVIVPLFKQSFSTDVLFTQVLKPELDLCLSMIDSSSLSLSSSLAPPSSSSTSSSSSSSSPTSSSPSFSPLLVLVRRNIWLIGEVIAHLPLERRPEIFSLLLHLMNHPDMVIRLESAHTLRKIVEDMQYSSGTEALPLFAQNYASLSLSSLFRIVFSVEDVDTSRKILDAIIKYIVDVLGEYIDPCVDTITTELSEVWSKGVGQYALLRGSVLSILVKLTQGLGQKSAARLHSVTLHVVSSCLNPKDSSVNHLHEMTLRLWEKTLQYCESLSPDLLSLFTDKLTPFVHSCASGSDLDVLSLCSLLSSYILHSIEQSVELQPSIIHDCISTCVSFLQEHNKSIFDYSPLVQVFELYISGQLVSPDAVCDIFSSLFSVIVHYFSPSFDSSKRKNMATRGFLQPLAWISFSSLELLTSCVSHHIREQRERERERERDGSEISEEEMNHFLSLFFYEISNEYLKFIPSAKASKKVLLAAAVTSSLSLSLPQICEMSNRIVQANIETSQAVSNSSRPPSHSLRRSASSGLRMNSRPRTCFNFF